MPAAQKLPAYLWEGLTGTQHMNIGLQVHATGVAFVTDADGARRYVRKTEQHYRLFFKLKGCCGGQQHYKHCTPQAVGKASGLWCPFCMYCAWQWAAAGKALINRHELEFMRLLRAHGCSDKWCHQARHDMWGGCFDFYNWYENVYVQVDGACHWNGMSANITSMVQDRDFRCNYTAFQSHVALVRVHESDVQQPQVVFAAIAIAAAEPCVVFTHSYRVKACPQWLNFIQAVHMYCHVRYDAFGNTICKREVAYLVLVCFVFILIQSVVQPPHGTRAGGELKVDKAVAAAVSRMG